MSNYRREYYKQRKKLAYNDPVFRGLVEDLRRKEGTDYDMQRSEILKYGRKAVGKILRAIMFGAYEGGGELVEFKVNSSDKESVVEVIEFQEMYSTLRSIYDRENQPHDPTSKQQGFNEELSLLNLSLLMRSIPEYVPLEIEGKNIKRGFDNKAYYGRSKKLSLREKFQKFEEFALETGIKFDHPDLYTYLRKGIQEEILHPITMKETWNYLKETVFMKDIVEDIEVYQQTLEEMGIAKRRDVRPKGKEGLRRSYIQIGYLLSRSKQSFENNFKIMSEYGFDPLEVPLSKWLASKKNLESYLESRKEGLEKSAKDKKENIEDKDDDKKPDSLPTGKDAVKAYIEELNNS